MTSSDYRKRIKGGLSGAYIFFGGEEYMKRFCLTETRKAVADDATLAAFNIVNITGSANAPKTSADGENGTVGVDFDLARAEEAISAPPMLISAAQNGGKKLIELHEFSFTKLSEAQIERFCALTDELDGQTILIIYCLDGEFDAGILPNKPSKLFITLSKFFTPVTFDPETPARLASWIQKHFTVAAIIAEPSECYALMKRCGHSMFVLTGEIEKLISYIKFNGGNHLTPEIIERVSCAYTETVDFGFTNAIQAGDSTAAFREMGVMKLNREKPELIMGMMTRFIGDVYIVLTLTAAGMTRGQIAARLSMNEGRVAILQRGIKGKNLGDLAALLSDCLQADKKLKSTGAESYMLTDRLCAEIFL